MAAGGAGDMAVPPLAVIGYVLMDDQRYHRLPMIQAGDNTAADRAG